MSLQKINKLKDEKGFTIVELLIVIVVIGILAAITIVAFNGVQNRAKVAGYQADANSIAKAAETVNAATQAYPAYLAADTTAQSTAKFNAGDAKLPANVQVKWASGNTAPTGTAAGADITTTPGTKIYTAIGCGTAGGIQVFYYDGTVAKSVTAGTCP